MARARSVRRSAPLVGGFYGAEACLYLAVAIFGAQALVILMSPAVALARQPEMVGEAAKVLAGVLSYQRIDASDLRRHGRTCPGHPRFSFDPQKVRRGCPAQAGHDESIIRQFPPPFYMIYII